MGSNTQNEFAIENKAIIPELDGFLALAAADNDRPLLWFKIADGKLKKIKTYPGRSS